MAPSATAASSSRPSGQPEKSDLLKGLQDVYWSDEEVSACPPLCAGDREMGLAARVGGSLRERGENVVSSLAPARSPEAVGARGIARRRGLLRSWRGATVSAGARGAGRRELVDRSWRRGDSVARLCRSGR